MSKAEQILLNRVKFIGDNEWTLLGCPDDVIKDLANIERQARIDEWNLISETLHSAGIQAELFLNKTRKDRIKELERGE